MVILMTQAVACSSDTPVTRVEVAIAEDERSAESTSDALDPRGHSQDISVEVVPAGAAIELAFVTERGVELGILGPDGIDDCPVRDNRSRCEVHLPVLEARTPGEWTASVQRLDPGPRVDVAVEIIWEPVGGDRR